MKVSDIEKRIADAGVLRDQLEQEKKEAERLATALREKAEAAAVSGDVDGYLRIKQELDRQEAIAHVRGTQLKQNDNPVSREDCIEAWNGYRKDYEKDLRAKLAEVDKARAAFIKAYNDAVAIQERACATRERLGRYIGIKTDALHNEADSAFPMLTIPVDTGLDALTLTCPMVGIQDKDLAFMIVNASSSRLNLATDPAVQRLLTVVNRRRST